MFVPVEVAPFDLDQWQYSRHGRLGSNWVSVAQNCWYQIVVFPSPVGLRKPLHRGQNVGAPDRICGPWDAGSLTILDV